MAKILIIEDNTDDSLLIKRVLKKLGNVNLFNACTGEEGMHKAKNEKPDLIITDIFLPGMNGFDVCRKIKKSKELSSIKVFILTGLTNDSDAAKAAEAGANAYIAKTGDYRLLAKAVKKLYGRAITSDLPDVLREQIKKQRNTWISKFSKKLKKMEDAWNILKEKDKKKELKNLYHLVHNLAGSARVFHIAALAKTIEPLEILLNTMINENSFPTIKEKSQIEEYIYKLKKLSLKSNHKKIFEKKQDEQNYFQQFSQKE